MHVRVCEREVPARTAQRRPCQLHEYGRLPPKLWKYEVEVPQEHKSQVTRTRGVASASNVCGRSACHASSMTGRVNALFSDCNCIHLLHSFPALGRLPLAVLTTSIPNRHPHRVHTVCGTAGGGTGGGRPGSPKLPSAAEKKAKWRMQSEQLRRAMMAAKGGGGGNGGGGGGGAALMIRCGRRCIETYIDMRTQA